MKNKTSFKVSTIVFFTVFFLSCFFFEQVAFAQEEQEKPTVVFENEDGDEDASTENSQDVEIVEGSFPLEEDSIPTPTLENSTEQINENQEEKSTVEEMLKKLDEKEDEQKETGIVRNIENEQDTYSSSKTSRKGGLSILVVFLCSLLLLVGIAFGVLIGKKNKN